MTFDASTLLDGYIPTLVQFVAALSALLLGWGLADVMLLGWRYFKKCTTGIWVNSDGWIEEDGLVFEDEGDLADYRYMKEHPEIDFYEDGYTEEDGSEYDRYGNPVESSIQEEHYDDVPF